MIDEIFELFMNEARSRPNKDLVLNMYNVLVDLHLKIFPAMEAIREEERRRKESEI